MTETVGETVRGKVVAILAEQAVLAPGDVRMSATLADLGIDSLGLVEAIYALEEAFDIQLPYNANDPAASEFDISTVGTMVAAVESLVAAAP